MMGQPLWYWAVFAAAALLWAAAPVAAWLERRSAARDREVWNRIRRSYPGVVEASERHAAAEAEDAAEWCRFMQGEPPPWKRP